MEISKSSWHYRLVVKFSGRHFIENNLCNYFWQVVGCLFAAGMFTVLGLLFAAAVVMPLLVLVNVYVPFLPNNQAILPLFIAGVLMYLGVIGYGIGHLHSLYQKAKAEREWEAYIANECNGTAPTPKEPGLLRAYLNALRDKTCVSLEFVDKSEA